MLSHVRAATIVMVLLSSAAVHAQEQDSEYWTLVRAAVQEHEAGQYREARSLYLRAHAIHPNARTLRALGMVSYELREYTDSVRYLAASLEDERNALDDTMRADAERLLGLARARVGRYRVRLLPPEARLAIDGAAPELEEDGSVLLAIGEHRLEATLEAYEPARREIEVVGGEDEEIELTLARAAPPIAERDRPTPIVSTEAPAAAEAPIYEAWWLWTIIGVVVVGGIAAALAVALYDPGTRALIPGTTGEIMTLVERP